MKTQIHFLICICLSSFSWWSCKKEETKALLADKPVAPVLSGSATALVLDSANKGDNAQVFTWTAAKYGYDAAVSYTLQLSLASDNFKSPVNLSMGSGLGKTYTVDDFNSRMLSLGTAGGVETAVQARVFAIVAPYGDTSWSNVFAFTVKPYKVVVHYPTIWAPGDYQGWNPSTAATMASVKSDDMYEGYAYFPAGGTLQFKLTSDPDWNHTNYGTVGNDAPIPGAAAPSRAGGLSKTGGNLTVPVAGYYKLNADLKALKWSALKTTWSVIGDATAGGWSNDTDMRFDAATQHWTVTTNLTATSGTTNQFKFRANHDWMLNLGVDANGNITNGGSNISVPSTGSYTIILDLSVPGNYGFTLKKN